MASSVGDGLGGGGGDGGAGANAEQQRAGEAPYHGLGSSAASTPTLTSASSSGPPRHFDPLYDRPSSHHLSYARHHQHPQQAQQQQHSLLHPPQQSPSHPAAWSPPSQSLPPQPPADPQGQQHVEYTSAPIPAPAWHSSTHQARPPAQQPYQQQKQPQQQPQQQTQPQLQHPQQPQPQRPANSVRFHQEASTHPGHSGTAPAWQSLSPVQPHGLARASQALYQTPQYTRPDQHQRHHHHQHFGPHPHPHSPPHAPPQLLQRSDSQSRFASPASYLIGSLSRPALRPTAMDNSQAAQAQAQAQAHAQALQAAQTMRRRNAQDVLMGQGFRGLKRGRPTDRSLPPSLKRQIPESAFYADLQRMERSLDWTVARKRAELTDGLSRPPKVKRTLRIFLSNTCADQPWQQAEKKSKEGKDKDKEATPAPVEGDAAGPSGAAAAAAAGGDQQQQQGGEAASKGEGDADQDAVPSWTLRIEGRLLEPSFKSRANTALSAQAGINRTGAHKFSNLIKTCVVELVRDPALYPEGGNLVEWHRPTPSVAPAGGMQAGGGAGGLGGTQGMEAPLVASAEPALDGFEIKRKGSVPTKVKIVIYPAYAPERYSLAPELASLLDIREETRAGVIAALWIYVKERKLLDETDRRRVKCDAALESLFKTTSINFHHIPEVINRFLHPPQPVVIEYYVRTDKAEYRHSTAYDIELEMEDLAVRQKQHSVLAKFDANDAVSKEIAELDDKIAQAAATIRNRSAARDFLASFAKDPQGHLRTWIASQSRDLDAILGNSTVPGAAGLGSTFTAEEMRKAETFKGAWVDEAVIVNESQRLAERLQELQGQMTAAGGMPPGAGPPGP